MNFYCSSKRVATSCSSPYANMERITNLNLGGVTMFVDDFGSFDGGGTGITAKTSKTKHRRSRYVLSLPCLPSSSSSSSSFPSLPPHSSPSRSSVSRSKIAVAIGYDTNKARKKKIDQRQHRRHNLAWNAMDFNTILRGLTVV